ncbi:uncharacterized protein LOC142985627 [Anticarsia gemmatalis]|uniref:uncharacterized protein LOC142985627 n=1 Tax=Anticarsia gemmatalis TaxID=129554 RepID=UPI003F77430B
MGSPTVSNAKPVPMENTEKKSLIKIVHKFFSHKKKEKNKPKEAVEVKQEKEKQEDARKTKNVDAVAAVLEKFDKLDLQEKKKSEDDELENFSFKVIEEPRNERINSHSSQDSGFSDKSENTSEEIPEEVVKEEKIDKGDELIEQLEKLDIDEKKSKKKYQTVVIQRTPIRTRTCNYAPSYPYPARDSDIYRQISQINTATLTGGQVIVNQCQQPETLSEVDIACETVKQNSQYQPKDHEILLQDVLEFIQEDTTTKQYGSKVEKKYDSNALLEDLEKKTIGEHEIMQLLQDNNYHIAQNNVEDINSTIDNEMFHYLQTNLNTMPSDAYMTAGYTYPTPPRSENVPSPCMSTSPASFYPSNSEYTLSPGRSPIYNSDYEKYQDIPHFEEEKETIDKKARERTNSISSMTMKQFKDMQKEIVYNFSKRECCQLSRKSCKELFEEHMKKLKMAERKDLCLKVATMDLKTAYGVLHHILLGLSRGSEQEDVHMALFSLICERVVAEDSTMFTGDAGLNLLKAAALRCSHKPLLTRYLAQCVRVAIKNNASLAAGKDYVFHEVDALGDTLVTACARAGDRCADVLYELVSASPPLFKLRHNNTDGYTALHVACSQHSAASPRLHTVHVLLEHGGFELTEGDLKGRDTALHLAVNSANCDLQLVLLMFKQVDRKEWKNLAHCANLSSKTPIDLARLATKSSARQNYPPEVLDFLKKCR